jgi:hypothetical protein
MVENGCGIRPTAWLLAWLGALPIARPGRRAGYRRRARHPARTDVGGQPPHDLYGRADVLASERVLRGGATATKKLDSLGVTCVLVRPSTGLGKQLSRDPAWRVVSHHRDAPHVRRPIG